MSEPQSAQEMTLEQCVERLPVCHSARKEYAKLLAASLPVDRRAPDEREKSEASTFRVSWNRQRGLMDNNTTQIDLMLAEAYRAGAASAENRGAAQPDLEAIALKEALSWALDLLDMYDKKLVALGEPAHLVYGAQHMKAKKKAREALQLPSREAVRELERERDEFKEAAYRLENTIRLLRAESIAPTAEKEK